MMNSRICELLDIEFPLVAFSHCRDVVFAAKPDPSVFIVLNSGA